MKFSGYLLVFCVFLSCADANVLFSNVAAKISRYIADNDTLTHLQNMFMRIYTDVDHYRDVEILESNSSIPGLNPQYKLVVYVHGWSESVNSSSVRKIISALDETDLIVKIAIDWSEIGALNYALAASSYQSVAQVIIYGFDRLFRSGMSPDNTHLIGHSMGGQIVGDVGRNGNFTLSRVTGLDPAGPGFQILLDGISTDSGRFVDIIHTDAGVYGTARVCGHVDFYPNGGHRVQPGCPPINRFMSTEDFCSHHRSYDYYAESVINKDAFIGIACENEILFDRGLCQGHATATMGYWVSPDVKGTYFLKTNSSSPFGEGLAGIQS